MKSVRLKFRLKRRPESSNVNRRERGKRLKRKLEKPRKRQGKLKRPRQRLNLLLRVKPRRQRERSPNSLLRRLLRKLKSSHQTLQLWRDRPQRAEKLNPARRSASQKKRKRRKCASPRRVSSTSKS
jgi:hypothetical protein